MLSSKTTVNQLNWKPKNQTKTKKPKPKNVRPCSTRFEACESVKSERKDPWALAAGPSQSPSPSGQKALGTAL